MAEIFKEAQGFDNHPDRWNHDLSHKHYGSYKAGVIYPVFSHLMCPSDSVRLDMASLLQFMPTPTPLQSNVRVIYHCFFQRLKNVHKDWPNTIEGLEEHDLPYILPSVSEFVPGSIHDFLDIPCCVVVNDTLKLPLDFYLGEHTKPLTSYTISSTSIRFQSTSASHSSITASTTTGLGVRVSPFKVSPSVDGSSPFQDQIVFTLGNYPYSSPDPSFVPSVCNVGVALTDDLSLPVAYVPIPVSGSTSPDPDSPFKVSLSDSSLQSVLSGLGFDGSQYLNFVIVWSWSASQHGYNFIDAVADTNPEDIDVIIGDTDFFIYGSYPLADFPHLCPFATKEFPDRPIRLKAFRHRVYESVYNAFYRNIHGNQPFRIDGVTQYNRYNTTTESGADSTTYHLFNRNWELDAYTSCLPSPQQGDVPYVGVSALGRVVVQDDDGTRSTMQLKDLSDGQQGFEVTQFDARTDSHRQILLRLADSGFTINDLRETNAFQKFLETNIRKGFRYIDFIKGHFGSAPKHAEMDMPEFVGGFTIKLDVGKVVNTNAAASANNPNDVLGQFAGSAQAFGSSQNSFSYYADDYGYLMVTQCIVPDSAYSQVLPKDYLYSNPLDFPFPDFSHLGYGPVTYEEFCPCEAFKDYLLDESKKITDVFGYQRPQYERVWLPDRLHGQFLTTMNNYVVNRVFEHRPELGDDFLQIHPEEMTRNFTVTKSDEDIAYGQVAFHITYKQPVPRISIPSLGR